MDKASASGAGDCGFESQASADWKKLQCCDLEGQRSMDWKVQRCDLEGQRSMDWKIQCCDLRGRCSDSPCSADLFIQAARSLSLAP
eukprot:692499-Amphidinium_carterae.1